MRGRTASHAIVHVNGSNKQEECHSFKGHTIHRFIAHEALEERTAKHAIVHANQALRQLQSQFAHLVQNQKIRSARMF
jgi:hypothetical protein